MISTKTAGVISILKQFTFRTVPWISDGQATTECATPPRIKSRRHDAARYPPSSPNAMRIHIIPRPAFLFVSRHQDPRAVHLVGMFDQDRGEGNLYNGTGQYSYSRKRSIEDLVCCRGRGSGVLCSPHPRTEEERGRRPSRKCREPRTSRLADAGMKGRGRGWEQPTLGSLLCVQGLTAQRLALAHARAWCREV